MQFRKGDTSDDIEMEDETLQSSSNDNTATIEELKNGGAFDKQEDASSG